MAVGALALIRLFAAALVLLVTGAVPLPNSAPGCIAAVTVVPIGVALSGQVVTLTDGSIVNPETRFISRSWTFGDGASATSSLAAQVATTHAYVNRSGRTQRYVARLTERTGLGDCTTTFDVDVSPNEL